MVMRCALFVTVSTGPEWRDTYLDETNKILEEPEDDGARHRLWATHTVKDRQWSYRTRVGGAFDLGRLLNYAANFVDTQVRDRADPLVKQRCSEL